MRATSALPVPLVAAVLCLVTFIAGGGLNLDTTTPVEIALTLGCGLGIAAAILLTPAARPARGLWSTGLLLALAALSAASVVWSVAPDSSWVNAGRLLAYSGVFAFAVLLARAAPARWSAVLGGVLLAAVVVCGYALLTKIFPASLGAERASVHTYARLREPYGYWNAVGLAAALGAIACMWLGTRRAGHAVLSALAYPAMGLMLVTVMLAYSRGALAALVLGLALWLWVVPLRLRGIAVLCTGAAGAGIVIAWDFSRHALTTDNMPLAARVVAGHQLGVLLAAVLLGLTLAGLSIGFLAGRRARGGLSVRTRRRLGAALLSLLAVGVIAFAGLLAVSRRGFTGTISHTFHTLTDPNAPVPLNGPGRLTALGSARARYWNEALEIFTAHPLLGVGAEGYETAHLRYRTAPVVVAQAHGFIVQTLADLGLVGLLVVLALLGAWSVAAGRTVRPFNGRLGGLFKGRLSGPLGVPVGGRLGERLNGLFGGRLGENSGALRGGPPAGSSSGGRDSRPARRYTPERIGLLTMLCLVVAFGIHSFVDWTWYVPGLACAALLCAGWLAGRGGIEGPPASGLAASGPSAPPPNRLRLPSPRDIGPVRGGLAAAVLAFALLAAWAQWQPQRSVDASNEAFGLVARDPAAALRAARAAVGYDPLSADALITLAAVEERAGLSAAAAADYERAVHLQPSNFKTWQALGEYDLAVGRSSAALEALRAAVYLNPQAVAPPASIATNGELLTIQDAYLRALRAVGSKGGTSAPGGGAATTTQPAGTAPRRGVLFSSPQNRPRTAAASRTARGGRGPINPPVPAVSIRSKPKS
jgi:O-Antigen ligase